MTTADVIIPVYRDVPLTEACIEAVLAHSGRALGQVWLINDRSPEPAMSASLSRFRLSDRRVHLFENEGNLGFVRTANLGLAASEADAVVLNSDAIVTAGWLQELLAVFGEEPRMAALTPLSNNAGMCSVPNYGSSVPTSAIKRELLELDHLPRFTELPTAHGFCLLLRRAALDALGPFDQAYGRGYHEENDWCQRARAEGWRVGRANRAFVFHQGEVSFQGARSHLDHRNGWRLACRYPRFFTEARALDLAPQARLAARAVRASLGLLHVWSTVPWLQRSLAAAAPLRWSAVDCDLAFVRPGEAFPPTAARVAVLEERDRPGLERGNLDAFLSASQGVVAPEAVSHSIAARFPSLRLARELTSFARELALSPDLAALDRQAEDTSGRADSGALL